MQYAHPCGVWHSRGWHRSPGCFRHWGAACILLGVWLGAASVSAQFFNYQTFPVGQRPLGMGGAATGVGGDVSAVYYNPGALVFLPNWGLSSSLSLRSFRFYKLEGGYSRRGIRGDLDGKTSPSVPAFLGYAARVGRRAHGLSRRHALAAAVVTPRVAELVSEARLLDAQGRLTGLLNTRVRERDTWYGGSYAFRVSRRLGLGLSLFLSHRRFAYEERGLELDYGPAIAPDVYSQSRQRAVRHQTRFRVFGLVLRLGGMYVINPKWTVGAMLHSPAIPLGGSAKVSETDAITDATGEPTRTTLFDAEQSGSNVKLPGPWELRLGVAHQLRPHLLLAADGSLHSPTRLRSPFQLPAPDPGARSPTAGLFVTEDWRTRMTANLALGLESLLVGRIPLKVGIYSDMSAARKIADPSLDYQAPNQHNIGSTMSFGYRAERYDIAFGSAVVFGRGKALRADLSDSTGQPNYSVGRLKETTVYFFITGATSTALKLAEDVYDKTRQELASGEEVSR